MATSFGHSSPRTMSVKYEEVGPMRISEEVLPQRRHPVSQGTTRGHTFPSRTHQVVESDLPEDESHERISPMRTTKMEQVQQKFSQTTRVKMERGISKASENEYIVSQARSQVENEFQPSPESPDSVLGGFPNGITACGFIDTPLYTFILPDLTIYPEDYRGFLEKDLIELSSLISLEQSGRLNWWAETGTCQRLWPLATTGDGNCLLHAASLGMWGFHDRLLTLRKALHSFLSSSEASAAIYRRWRWQSHLQNLQYGLQLSEREWEDEWRSVLRLASSEPRHGSSCSSASSASSSAMSMSPSSSNRRWSRISLVAMGGESDSKSQDGQPPTMYESLEEVHVLALAHILRRPIIVVADTVLRDMNGDALAPIPFGGVYLPLECPAADCHKSPLLLTYNAGHFSALVSMQSEDTDENSWLPAVIPLTDSNHSLQPLHFAIDPGPNFTWNRDEYQDEVVHNLTIHPNTHVNLLNAYLEIVKVGLPDYFLDPPNMNHNPKSSKQAHSVAKQFGSIGKKLKKNLGKLTRNSSFRSDQKDGDYQQGVRQSTRIQQKIVSGAQPFILAAFIHTNSPLPYQNEMVENYLQDARRRFEVDRELKAKQREEQIELEEKRKRDIYLNGGYIDCLTPGCVGQGTSDNGYLCKSCLAKQKTLTNRIGDPSAKHGNSKFYVSSTPAEAADMVDGAHVILPTSKSMTVKLPAEDDLPITSKANPCRSGGCDFYGSPEFNFLCSKCYSQIKKR
eukprot:snap_masked-scaffold158_size296719-processed-gene-1.14 protein:Tk05689 transcript:snap_masked-scaffold158_size296719-processed-gene-1.14-mRNA-1 annotation:"conserved hypothetical protein"